jgi:hypothetical protein
MNENFVEEFGKNRIGSFIKKVLTQIGTYILLFHHLTYSNSEDNAGWSFGFDA